MSSPYWRTASFFLIDQLFFVTNIISHSSDGTEESFARESIHASIFAMLPAREWTCQNMSSPNWGVEKLY